MMKQSVKLSTAAASFGQTAEPAGELREDESDMEAQFKAINDKLEQLAKY